MGATTTLSPVWNPHGVHVLHPADRDAGVAASRITSNSISFQPITGLLDELPWWIRDRVRPTSTIRFSSSREWAIPPPEPPGYRPARMNGGQADDAVCFVQLPHIPQDHGPGPGSPMNSIRFLNCSRSSPR